MATLGYKDIISSGVARGKSYEEIRKALAQTNNLSGTSIQDLDLVMNGGEADKGARLSAGQATTLGEGDAALNAVTALENNLEGRENIGGPVAGIIRSIDPREQSTVIDAEMKMMAQNVGGYLEGGKLTDDDIARYRKMLPNMRDTAATRAGKIQNVKNLVNQRKEVLLKGYEQAGFDVSGYSEGEEGTGPSNEQVMKQLNDAHKQATENPDDPRSQKFLEDWDNDKIDLTTGKLKDEFRELTPYEQKVKEQQDSMVNQIGAVEEETGEDPGFVERVFNGDTGLVQNLSDNLGELKNNLVQTGTDVANAFTEVKDATGDAFQALKDGDMERYKIETEKARANSRLGTMEGAVGLLGTIGKFIGDLGVTSLEVADDATKNIVSNTMTGALDTVIEEIAQTETGQEGLEAIQAGVEQWNEFAEANPDTAKDIGNLMGIMEGVTVITGGIALKKGVTTGAKAVASGTKKALPVAGEVLESGLTTAKKVIPGKKTPEALAKKVEKDLTELAKGKAPLRNFAEDARKKGVDVNKELSESNVLQGTVDDNGTITTIGEGGAIENYQKNFIDGLDVQVSEGLKAEGKTMNVDSIEKSIMNTIDESDDLVGSLEETAKSRAGREIEALRNKYPDGEVPLEDLNKLKIALNKTVNYNNPDVAAGEKTLIRGIKEFIEESSDDVKVKDINQQLSKHYTVVNYLEKMNGAKVEGGRLGKYFAGTAGAGIGALLGAPGGFGTSAVGAAVGSQVGSKLKGFLMKRTFGKAIDFKIKSGRTLNKAEINTVVKKVDDLVEAGEIPAEELTLIEKTIEGMKGKGGMSIDNITKDVEEMYMKKYATKSGLTDLMAFIKKDGMSANSLDDLGGKLTKAGFEEGKDSEMVGSLWEMIQKNPGSFTDVGKKASPAVGQTVKPKKISEGIVEYPEIYHGTPTKGLTELDPAKSKRTSFGANAVVSGTDNPNLAKSFTRGEFGDKVPGEVGKVKGPLKIIDVETKEGAKLWESLDKNPKKVLAAGYDGIQHSHYEDIKIKSFYKDIDIKDVANAKEIQLFKKVKYESKASPAVGQTVKPKKKYITYESEVDFDKFDEPKIKKVLIPEYVYHTTNIDNVESISKKGLIPKFNSNFNGTEKATFAWSSKSELGPAEAMLKDKNKIAKIRINTKKLKPGDDIDIDTDMGGDIDDAVGVWQLYNKIEPEYLEIKVGGKWKPLKANPAVGQTVNLAKEAKKYKSADEAISALESKYDDVSELVGSAEYKQLARLGNDLPFEAQKDLKNGSFTNKESYDNFKKGMELRQYTSAKNKEVMDIKRVGMDARQRERDLALRKTDNNIDALKGSDNDFLAEQAKGTSLDEFLGKMRGSSTQYGEYNPKLRKYLSPDSLRLSDVEGFNPNDTITVYRGIDGRAKSINTGDFVTMDFDDAASYTSDASKVVSKEIKAKNLVSEYPDEIVQGEDIYELIYYPSSKEFVKVTDTKLTDIWNKANNK